jgi:HYR domain
MKNSSFLFALLRHKDGDTISKLAAVVCLLLMLEMTCVGQGATNQIKWNQPPAPAHPTNVFYGWNQLSVEYPFLGLAADDWVCMSTNPVTKIRWWGSFMGWTSNTPPPVAPNAFQITISSDVPANIDAPYSHPDGVVWQFACQTFTCQFVGWDYDPRNQTFDACFLFEQTLTPAEYWTQPGGPGTIYWLSIGAMYPQGTAGPWPWGWKTRPRDPASPAPDDAVVSNNGVVPWTPLFWPDPANSWDLAFELISSQADAGSKWEQPPDLSTTGMDVKASKIPTPYLLADDFQCTSTGYITNITVWGSYSNDVAPGFGTNATFTLSIHDDIPAFNAPWNAPYSMPGALRWVHAFTNNPIQYKCSILASNLNEGWLTPPAGYVFPGDHTCYQYDFNIPINQAFLQEGTPAQPRVYWLDVQGQYPGPVPQFGWKTSTKHWNDGTVWVNGTETYNGIWNQLLYPSSIVDLAFRLNASTGAASEVTKWSQPPVIYTPPDAYNGWNQYSVWGSTNIVADDWVCTNATPVTDIHWWGSFIGWSEPYPPQMPDAFALSIWTDVPKGIEPFSHPGVCLRNIFCNNFTWTFAGWDFDPRNPGAPPEACFKFEQELLEPEWFAQDPGTNTYWLSIAAIHTTGEPEHPWGWKTRPRDTSSLAPDDAVRIVSPTAPAPVMIYQYGENIWWPKETNSWDMAFVLTTLEQSNCVKVVCSTNIVVTCAPTNGTIVTYYSYATNICTGQLLPVTCSPPSGSLFPVGITQVCCTNVTSGVTNSCCFTVTVLTDTTPPGITCPSNIVANVDAGQCSKSNVTFVVTASDDCDPSPVITCNPPSGSTFTKGLTTVNCTVRDATGNSNGCSFTVTILDKELPSVTCSSNIVANTDPGQCSKSNVTFTATASDNCPGVTVACVPPSGSTFAKGVTTVRCTATDASGNTNSCSFTVTIRDLEPPGVTCSSNIVAVADCDQDSKSNVTFTATATDNCPGVTVACVPPSGSTFSLGTTIVTCTVTDASGNTNSCSFTVTISYPAPSTNIVITNIVFTTKFNGWNEPSMSGSWVAADDWVCTTTNPVTDIRWWGSFLRWQSNAPPTLSGAFQIAFWTDVPAGVDAPFSHPGQLLREVYCTSYTWQFVGWDLDPRTLEYEACFRFDQRLADAERFYQTNRPTGTNIYWVSIAAVYPQGVPEFVWGWKTRPRATNSPAPDDAVRFVFPQGPYEPLWWPDPANSWDLAFELVSSYTNTSTKWEQPPDLSPAGIDVNDTSYFAPPPLPYLLADDFQCNATGPLTDITIWGSWTNDLVPSPDFVSFTLSIHKDVPVSPTNAYSIPGQLLWQQTFGPGQYQLQMIPVQREGWLNPPSDYISEADHFCFQYDFHVATDAFVQTNGTIYWLDVQANLAMPIPVPRFGWKTSPLHWNDDAVWANGSEQGHSSWSELRYPPQHPFFPQSIDLAFRLVGSESNYQLKWSQPPVTSRYLTVEWNSEDCVHYQLQATTYLSNAPAHCVWTNVGPEVIGPVHEQSDTNMTALQRFYRIVAP